MIRSLLFFTLLSVTALSLSGMKMRFTQSSFTSHATNQSNSFLTTAQFATPQASPGEATPSPTPDISPVPTATPTPVPSPTPVPGIANHIVISEVQINGGTGNAGHDFIELYNPTNQQIDLKGMRLVLRAGSSATDESIKSWTDSTFIPAYGFYLWANSSDADSPFIAIADTTTTTDVISTSSLAIRNGPLNTGAIVDAISWNVGSTIGEGAVFATIPGANQSIERKAYSTSTAATMNGGVDSTKGNGFDLNTNSTDFILRTTSQPQNSASAIELP